ncbi:MAG: methionine synthase [Planctomycetota bacterium]|nr:methionine synthase [Planctomycetota bacterium]
MTASFRDILSQRVLIMDGAMGTAIHALGLDLERDFKNLENCCEVLNETAPTAIRTIHEEYLEVGCDAVETNTFGATPLTLGEFGAADRARDWNLAAARIAREACERYASDERPRFVVGSMGPGTRLPSLGHVGFDELQASYAVQARALAEGGVDAFAVETCQDPLQIKAALSAIRAARDEADREIATIVSVTMEVTGTMLVGTDMAAAVALLDPFDIDVLALNCATGPREMGEHIRSLAKTCRSTIGVYPNAGLPQLVDGLPSYPLTPEELADWLLRFVREDGVSLVGGCCGTTPAHMREVVQMVAAAEPATRSIQHIPQVTSIYGAVPLRQDKSLLLVGERSNANGSKAFREHLLGGDLDAMVQLGRDQLRDGSHLLDVCAAYVGRDEVADLGAVVERYRTDVPAPLMIDSTHAGAIEAALKACGGRSVINSINLEDGEERCAEILPLAREHGAAVVCLTIDEDGMAKSADEKVRIARRLFELCVDGYGMRPEDLLFDVLTFTICTGNEDDRRLGLETLEAIKRLSAELPEASTLLGLSNISFGLRPAARHVLNSVFMHHAQEAGLTAAILHPGRIEPLHRIDPQALRVAEDLIFDRRKQDYDPLQEFMALFENVEVRAKRNNTSPDDLWERLRWRIIEGERDGLAEDLELAREEKEPLAIINQDLLGGMAKVGELFGAGDMQLPFVLQSAETMKAAVRHLEPHMDSSDQTARGKLVLATVRGDVHDIGKNLVDIILSNNGYRVINLGIKVPPQELIEAYQEHQPDIIGLSGLLVKSAQMMVETVRDFREAGVACPLLVGGAALSNRFARLRIAPEHGDLVAYAPDAMAGLSLANTIQEADERQKLAAALDAETSALLKAGGLTGSRDPGDDTPAVPPARARHDFPIPNPPDLRLHVLRDFDLEQIFPYINPQMLYGRHLGFNGRYADALAAGDPSAQELRDAVRSVEEMILASSDIGAGAVFKFFPCQADGQRLLVYGSDGRTVLESFYFGRQSQREGLCLSDYVLPKSTQPSFTKEGREGMDYVAMFVTSIGSGVPDLSERLRRNGRFLDSHILQALALECAEGFAELLHQQIRQMWGFGDQHDIPHQDLFRTRYRGRRYSFGYSACPRLEDQEGLFRLLDVTANIGVELTEGFMMDPEASVSALVFHHHDAKYFSLSPADIDRLDREIASL